MSVIEPVKVFILWFYETEKQHHFEHHDLLSVSAPFKTYSFGESLTYHVNSHIIAQTLISWQQVTKDDGASLWSVPGLHQDPGVDLQRREVLVVIYQTDVVHLQLSQGLVIIIFPEFKLVQCHKHTALILAAEKLAALVGALCEALAPALLLGDRK